MVPYPNHGPLCVRRSKDRHQRLNFSLVGADREVIHKRGVNLIGIRNMAQIANLEGWPEKTSDATRVIPPSHTGPMLQLLEGRSPLTSQQSGLTGKPLLLRPLLLPTTGLQKSHCLLGGWREVIRNTPLCRFRKNFGTHD